MHTRSHALKIPFWHLLSSRALFFCLASSLLVIFIFYVYLINKTVANVVARDRTERDIASLSGAIGDMEFEYISLKNSVTIDLARSKGFEDASPIFISRAGSQLSYNSGR